MINEEMKETKYVWQVNIREILEINGRIVVQMSTRIRRERSIPINTKERPKQLMNSLKSMKVMRVQGRINAAPPLNERERNVCSPSSDYRHANYPKQLEIIAAKRSSIRRHVLKIASFSLSSYSIQRKVAYQAKFIKCRSRLVSLLKQFFCVTWKWNLTVDTRWENKVLFDGRRCFSIVIESEHHGSIGWLDLFRRDG